MPSTNLNLEVVLLGQVAAVVGSGSRSLGLAAFLLMSRPKMLLLLLDLLLKMLLVSGVGVLLLLL